MVNLEEKTIKQEVVYKGKILNVELHDVVLPDGTFSKRELLKHNGAVAILAVTDNNEILLVEQYRKAVEMTTLEIPAGKLDVNEDPLECAVRELKEETGYTVNNDSLEKICETHVAIGYSSELITIYFVDKLSKEQLGDLALDEDEFLNLKKYSLDEAMKLLDNNSITDSKTIIALQWLKNRKG
ncbi:NUDIX domain-containing protein [Gemelliphila palaticanis]|uniref:NUDIX hydrolase n=1 Tax=Gemelliphila palaticanis TaxID=81950 RepID=A0ABX2T0N3_9BACL|nr:NUDIX hydrolase [Gemella palaticanis]MBF0715019.1 NUDIX hydrolase [Gemella palaticanis]NYS46949.1 NUDIX hydrolase [Gemella palaticanis]